MLAIGIQELLARGTTDEEIETLIGRFRERSGILFTVDTLEFLAKGGRIGRGKALMGSLLNVKPILAIDDGEVHPVTRARGRAKAFDEFGSVSRRRRPTARAFRSRSPMRKRRTPSSSCRRS